MSPDTSKPLLTAGQIVKMNVGFLGLQFSFGLQQANMSPIWAYLGADYANIPWLNLAGPVTGLLVQPIVGAMSDRTITRYGRRTPYFLIGAILCSLALLAMPYSPALWVAASLLWILDAANNITMEPYRAYVKDRLRDEQQPAGFLTQSAFTGLAQTLSFAAPTLLIAGFGMSLHSVDSNNIPHVTKVAFLIGAVLSITTILYSVFSVRELPLTEAQKAEIRRKPVGVGATLREIWDAILAMPHAMRQLAVMKLCQWFGMACYWQYVSLSIAKGLFNTSDPTSAAFREAMKLNGEAGAFSNAIACVAALAMIPLSRRLGAKPVHAVSLLLGGAGMLAITNASSTTTVFVAMVGIGLAWGSIMGNSYIMLARSIPPERTGVYMGIFNMMIVIPMLIQSAFVATSYKTLLGSDPRNALMLGGVMMVLGAVAALWVKVPKAGAETAAA
jgi:maltose/moltooligosaccharide transporter